jgi:hypothetical protein
VQQQLGQWPVGGVWQGLKAFLEALPPHGMAELLENSPRWSDVILSAAAAAFMTVQQAASAAAGGALSQQQHQGLAVLPPAAEGLLHLLGALEMLLQQPGELVWAPTHPTPAQQQQQVPHHVAAGPASILPAAGVSPAQLAAGLIRCCWGLVRHPQRGLAQAALGCCKQLLLARGCHWREPGVLGEELLPLAGVLLVQLPGSSAVDPLIRGVALEVRVWGWRDGQGRQVAGAARHCHGQGPDSAAWQLAHRVGLLAGWQDPEDRGLCACYTVHIAGVCHWPELGCHALPDTPVCTDNTPLTHTHTTRFAAALLPSEGLHSCPGGPPLRLPQQLVCSRLGASRCSPTGHP